jgi:hypothetical protein
MTFSGFTGCGDVSMLLDATVATDGTSTDGALTTHGQCGDSVVPHDFRFVNAASNGSGTAGLGCSPGCGWNLTTQVSRDRQTFTLVDVDPLNPLLNDPRFNGYWPPERPPIFFGRFTPTADEARALFEPADRLPLFEAVYHDAVVAVDRWNLSLTKVVGQEARRYAGSLLYGIPTIWNPDRRDLASTGVWLKAAHDDFQAVHGVSAPVALTDFAWLTDDRDVQQVGYADGRIVTANFGRKAWQGLPPNCIRVTGRAAPARTFCPPATSLNTRRIVRATTID